MKYICGIAYLSNELSGERCIFHGKPSYATCNASISDRLPAGAAARRMKTMKINSSLARSLARLRNREPDGESEGAVAEVLSRFSFPTVNR